MTLYLFQETDSVHSSKSIPQDPAPIEQLYNFRYLTRKDSHYTNCLAHNHVT